MGSERFSRQMLHNNRINKYIIHEKSARDTCNGKICRFKSRSYEGEMIGFTDFFYTLPLLQ